VTTIEMKAPTETVDPTAARVADHQRSDGRIDAVLAVVRARGGRMTAPRRAILEVLLAGGGHEHLTAEDLVAGVRRLLPRVAESTVYRTLTALEDLGVINHVHLGHGPSTYHLTSRTHRHLVCEHCDQVVEIPAAEFAGLASSLSNTYGFALSDEHFALVGTCGACRVR
jgi:Fur family ferric uptake transcriptional regulator